MIFYSFSAQQWIGKIQFPFPLLRERTPSNRSTLENVLNRLDCRGWSYLNFLSPPDRIQVVAVVRFSKRVLTAEKLFERPPRGRWMIVRDIGTGNYE
jgi:hypothetical protein